ncbi:aquaporin family protein [Tissierella creatinini]|nr:aquaporin family protein [Tissierella creatinini]TJX62813.1 aquaporin family protein [Soehngenia saccharolytica]
MMYKREFIGEFIGTFILVLFGCGSVAVSVLFDAHQGLFQIAAVWGIGVSLAIYATRHISCAHLNPAVTLAMVSTKRMVSRKMPIYLAAQFIGAFTAGLVLYLLFGSAIASFENSSGIIRGTAESIGTAKIFGEFYINNGNPNFSFMLAAIAEAFGTFLLVLMIFSLTEGCNLGRPDDNLAPIFIGLTVTSVICLLAPLTQAGLNPARDFGPRMVAWIFGWGQAAFPDQSGGFFFVYMLAPVIGGQVAGLLFTRVLEPLMKIRKEDLCCCGNDKSLKVKEDVK